MTRISRIRELLAASLDDREVVPTKLTLRLLDMARYGHAFFDSGVRYDEPEHGNNNQHTNSVIHRHNSLTTDC